jgi:hypothetical protein
MDTRWSVTGTTWHPRLPEHVTVLLAAPVVVTAPAGELEEPPEDEDPERYPAPDEPCARRIRLLAPALARPRRARHRA